MFFLNTYRWDFPQVAALVAPRPLLIGNSDKDNLFPLDGVVRLYNETRRIYQLYGKTNQLGLLITEGPHADTQDLQLPVFRWFNKFLKGQSPLIEMAARDFFPPEQLRVFDKLPEDQVNTTIDESFVPKAAPPRPLASPRPELPHAATHPVAQYLPAPAHNWHRDTDGRSRHRRARVPCKPEIPRAGLIQRLPPGFERGPAETALSCLSWK